MLGNVIEGLEGLGGWAIAVGAAVIAAPLLVRVVRPVAKGTIKAYFAATDEVQSAGRRTRESVRDIVAEARAEREMNASSPAA